MLPRAIFSAFCVVLLYYVGCKLAFCVVLFSLFCRALLKVFNKPTGVCSQITRYDAHICRALIKLA